MTDLHVIVGAGPVGLATARLLVAEGHEVRLVSRSGSGAEVPGATRVAADAADAERLTDLAQGAVAIYNCVNPPSYDVWPTYWPPIASRAPDSGREDRCGAGDHGQPLRVRPRRGTR